MHPPAILKECTGKLTSSRGEMTEGVLLGKGTCGKHIFNYRSKLNVGVRVEE